MSGREILIPGKLYKISLGDCCIIGEATARFVGFEWEESEYEEGEEHDISYADLRFDTLFLETAYDGAVSFTLIEE